MNANGTQAFLEKWVLKPSKGESCEATMIFQGKFSNAKSESTVPHTLFLFFTPPALSSRLFHSTQRYTSTSPVLQFETANYASGRNGVDWNDLGNGIGDVESTLHPNILSKSPARRETETHISIPHLVSTIVAKGPVFYLFRSALNDQAWSTGW